MAKNNQETRKELPVCVSPSVEPLEFVNVSAGPSRREPDYNLQTNRVQHCSQNNNLENETEQANGADFAIPYQNDSFQYPRDYVTTLRQSYPDLEIPDDMTPIAFTSHQTRKEDRKRSFSRASIDLIGELFDVFESSAPADNDYDGNRQEATTVNDEEDGPTRSTDTDAAAAVAASSTSRSGRHQKRAPSDQDRVYRSDREYVKRHSHKRMIWFFRKVGLRHPAAVRTHLEKVKHPEFELPNLQCVLPHPDLSIVFDDKFEAEGEYEETNGRKRSNRRTEANNNKNNTVSSGANRNEPNMTFYQLYCATTTLVERVRKLMGETDRRDEDHNKRVLTFIADIVGRLLWHNNRTHTVMFAKSDHYNRECFLLYSRQAEPTPFMMRSDKYFCRRHDSERFKFIAPQPDLTRANSTRVSNESSIYVVGCNVVELWESFPYEYRTTNARPMKALYDRISRIDPSVMEHAFSPVNKYVNGDRRESPYVEVASRTSFDVLSVYMRDANLKEIRIDDSVEYRSFVERFVIVGVLNVHCMLKTVFEMKRFGGYRDNSEWRPSAKRLDQIVLHHIQYRREVRELLTNRVFYYRNANDFICSLSLLDDLFEDGITTENVGERGEKNHNVVYFYDLLQPSEYDEIEDVNDLALQCWDEVETMVRESSHTIRHRLTDDILKGPIPEDPFYPSSDMSPTDVAIDRMLERAIKHSKRLQLLTPTLVKCKTDRKATTRLSDKMNRRKGRTKKGRTGERSGVPMEEDPLLDTNVIVKSLSKTGENRLQEGYLSPSRPGFITDHHVEHNGQRYHVKISASSMESECKRKLTKIDYGTNSCIRVDRKLMCVYLVDPNDERQIRLVAGSKVIERDDPDFIHLRMTDRIIRVFAIQAMNDSYLVKPYAYFVFRNIPICSIKNELVDQLFKEMQFYEGFQGFNVFKEFEENSCPDVQQTERDNNYARLEPTLQQSQGSERYSTCELLDVKEMLGIMPQRPTVVPVPFDRIKDETIEDTTPLSGHRQQRVYEQRGDITDGQSALRTFEEFILPGLHQLHE